MYKLVLSGFLLFSSMCGWCAIQHTINMLEPLKCELSSLHQNRIMVENAAIDSVIVPAGLFRIQIEEKSGQAFIFPISHSHGPVTISVITSNGQVQDLEVVLKECSSVVVVLKEFVDDVAPYSIPLVPKCEMAANLVKSIFRGESIGGFVKREKPSEDFHSLSSPKGIFTHLTDVYEGPFSWIYVFNVKNGRSKKTLLKEKDFHSVATDEVFLKHSTLAAGETGLLAVWRRKDG